MTNPEKGGFIPRQVDRRPFNLTTEPWKSDAQLLAQLTAKPFRGEGFLMHAETGQLREALFAITKDWKNAKLICDIVPFVSEVHKDQKRKDGNTPYEHHLLRTAIRVAQLGIGDSNMVAVALLHDAPEDHNVTFDTMAAHFTRLGYTRKTIAKLFAGANALSNQRDGVPLDTEAYFANINDAYDDYPDLHLWAIKGIDRLDNLNSDLSFAARHDNNSFDHAKQIQKYLEKTTSIVPQVEENEPHSGVGELLAASLQLARELMSEHGLQPQE